MARTVGRTMKAVLCLGMAISVALGMGLVQLAPQAGADTRPQAAGTNTLATNQTLSQDQAIISPNGRYRLVMQGDGNLVLYGPSGVVWATGTTATGSTNLVMQGDGNLVLYGPQGAMWSTGTRPAAEGGRLVLFDEGNLVLHNAKGARVWSARSGLLGRIGSTMYPEWALTSDMYLSSPDGRFRSVMQADGNLITFGPKGPVWTLGTSGRDPRAVLQQDNNLVVYANGVGVWANGASSHGPVLNLTQQNDGNLVSYSPGNGAIWSSFTGLTGRAGNELRAGQFLSTDNFLQSQNGSYRLALVGNGQLVLYGPSGAIWWTNTAGKGGNSLAMQGDGNLVLYGGGPVWGTGTDRSGANRLTMQDDGNAVVYNGAGQAVWSSRANPPKPLAPPNSGSGRRVVYSNPRQRVWWVNENNEVERTYLVSGRYGSPSGGTYHVYRKNPLAWAGHDGITMRWMVEFAPGGLGIGFHAIPRYADGTPLQSESQLGTYRSAGCVRQADHDSYALYQWASIGTKVVVVY